MDVAIRTMSAADVAARAGAMDVVDVRSPGEFRSGHARGARNVPLEGIEAVAVAAGKELVLICKSGKRASIAAERLAARGVSACVVEGGTDAWAAAGCAMESSGRGVISVERQVRIGAGLLVLAGVVLGFLVHPGFFGLSGFVGAGLVFAGATDWCGMALVLGRCPWNR